MVRKVKSQVLDGELPAEYSSADGVLVVGLWALLASGGEVVIVSGLPTELRERLNDAQRERMAAILKEAGEMILPAIETLSL